MVALNHLKINQLTKAVISGYTIQSIRLGYDEVE